MEYEYRCRKYQCKIVSKKPDKWGVLPDGTKHPCFENEKGAFSECKFLERVPSSPS